MPENNDPCLMWVDLEDGASQVMPKPLHSVDLLPENQNARIDAVLHEAVAVYGLVHLAAVCLGVACYLMLWAQLNVRVDQSDDELVEEAGGFVGVHISH